MRNVIFQCLGCGKVELVKVEHLYPILGGWVRGFTPPAGWMVLYPAESGKQIGVCPDCLSKLKERR